MAPKVFFFFLIIYLLIYFRLCWVFTADRAFFLVAASGGYSLDVVRELLIAVAFVAEPGLCGMWASVFAVLGFYSISLIVVAHRLSCSEACGIFPDPGLNLCLLHWQADTLPLSHQASPSSRNFYLFFFLLPTVFWKRYGRSCGFPW